MMLRMARHNTSLRISDSALERLAALGAEHGLSRSDVIRACLAVALSPKNRTDLHQTLAAMKETR